MAHKTILVSDLSGAEIPEDQHAAVTIQVNDSRYTADVLKEEIAPLLSVANKGKRRGRPKKKAATA